MPVHGDSEGTGLVRERAFVSCDPCQMVTSFVPRFSAYVHDRLSQPSVPTSILIIRRTADALMDVSVVLLLSSPHP